MVSISHQKKFFEHLLYVRDCVTLGTKMNVAQSLLSKNSPSRKVMDALRESHDAGVGYYQHVLEW